MADYSGNLPVERPILHKLETVSKIKTSIDGIDFWLNYIKIQQTDGIEFIFSYMSGCPRRQTRVVFPHVSEYVFHHPTLSDHWHYRIIYEKKIRQQPASVIDVSVHTWQLQLQYSDGCKVFIIRPKMKI